MWPSYPPPFAKQSNLLLPFQVSGFRAVLDPELIGQCQSRRNRWRSTPNGELVTSPLPLFQFSPHYSEASSLTRPLFFRVTVDSVPVVLVWFCFARHRKDDLAARPLMETAGGRISNRWRHFETRPRVAPFRSANSILQRRNRHGSFMVQVLVLFWSCFFDRAIVMRRHIKHASSRFNLNVH